MLGILRKYKESIIIKAVFVIIVASFIGTIFLVWGKGDRGSGGKGGFIARVNGVKIGPEDFQSAYTRIRGIYQQIYGPAFTPELEKSLKLKEKALDSIADRILVGQAAGKMGIKVSKDEVAQEIARNPAFQKNGAFDFETYQQLLRANRITPAAFEASEKEDLLGRKAQQKITEQVKVTDDDVLKEFHKRNDKVDLLFVSYAPGDVLGEVKVSDAELDAYLQSHRQEFLTPDMVAISYVMIDPATEAGKVSITEEEANTFYQKNIDRYQGKGGILPYAEVKDRVRADALRSKAAKQAYEDAADALNRNLKTGDIAAAAASLKTKVVETPLFTAVAPPASFAGDKEVVTKAFMLKQGELGGPVETKRGVFLLKVRERKPAELPPLAKVRSIVEKKAKEEKARDLAKKKAEEALQALTKGETPKKAQETGLFSWEDKTIPKVGPSPEIDEAAFALTAASPVAKQVFKVGERWYAIKLKSRSEASAADFAAKKEQLRAALLPKKQQEALEAWLKKLRSEAKIEKNPTIFNE